MNVEARLGSQAALQGERSGRGGGRVLTSVLAVCEAIAVAVQLQDVDVMGEPVEERAVWPDGSARSYQQWADAESSDLGRLLAPHGMRSRPGTRGLRLQPTQVCAEYLDKA